ncbi:PREDICTED: iduronate 2-sulfatase-like [Amphimedon queenslandica]|uniref:Sulfatase N-terminal domain-containing protein n=1 Tax=Amphimedon queenslandica TaxID=400682 RepID=A0AAN0ILI8_AMPQE|nr:PREDICTED: iduronate 2-sulfatase-like [Amphimedon queenslandica]|eukprot:XP_011403341.1 PREDICTED: iduronate 2-sulfatase-like [Amphimedon queenslandica]
MVSFVNFLSLLLLLLGGSRAQKDKKNVLFVAVDDLRPELGAYGADYVSTPNIDSLASKSILFERAYCQVAVCSPSRASLLTGRRPDTNHVWRISDDEYWRTTSNATNATTIPQYFKENGYISIGMGKIFHPGAPGGNNDELYSWSLPYFEPSTPRRMFNAAQGAAWYSFSNLFDNDFDDGKVSQNAINLLEQLKQNRSDGDSRPFFMAIGFMKPHLPFYCPSQYYDLYPGPDEIKLPNNPDPPQGMPHIAWTVWREMRNYYPSTSAMGGCTRVAGVSLNNPNCSLTSNETREARRGYYACTSYVDAQVGKIMSALDSQGFANDTIVVLWGDHGFHLGELGMWSKNTNFEDATRVPFILHVPGVTDNGMKTDALVELIDLFPSLTELAGIDVPPMCTENSPKSIACVEGSSVAPLLKNPSMEWKKGAFSQYPRPTSGLPQILGRPEFDDNENGESVMGYSVRVDDYRFTEWYRFNRTTSTPNFTDIWGTELYNHTTPTVFFDDENTNLASRPNMADKVQELRAILQAGWRGALPNVTTDTTPAPSATLSQTATPSRSPIPTTAGPGEASSKGAGNLPIFVMILLFLFILAVIFY